MRGANGSLRVLHVFDHSIPLHSGYSFRSRSILTHQRAFGIETLHVTGPKQGALPEARERVDGFDFFRTQPDRFLEGLPLLGHWGTVRALQKRLDEVIRDTRPDIVHAHSPVLNALAALPVVRKHELPLVYEVRAFWEDAAVDHGTIKEGGARYRASRALETYVLKRADAVTVICQGLRSDIVDRGLAPERITVIPNAVDIERFRGRGQPDEDLRKRLGLDGARLIGFIGSFYAYEGLPLLLDALPLVLETLPEVRLLLVGGGPQDEALRKKARELGLEDRVVFTGRVPHDAVQSYYDLVDVFVYPRFPIRLTELVTPLKPLEAMAQEALVVASNVGGHRELIEHERTGVLFEAGNPHALADALSNLLTHPETWPSYRERARRFVETERTWRASVERYRGVYESVLGLGTNGTGTNHGTEVRAGDS